MAGLHSAESGVSSIIKLGLVFVLASAFLGKRLHINVVSYGLWLCFLLLASYLFFFVDSSHTASTAIYYFFPVILAFLVFVCNGRAEIKKEEFLLFLRLVVGAVGFMALYALVFSSRHVFEHVFIEYGIWK